jgi:hypothetical protein
MRALRFRAQTGLLALLLAAAAGDDAAWLARGAEAVAPLKRGLLAALEEALARGGPEGAIDVCRVRAPEIAARASSPTLRVGRTSDRLRNPANAPADWMRPILEAWRAAPGDRAARVVHLPEGRVGYAEPIVVQPLCLACHGESLSPALREHLAARYPEDRATGYRAGELRGLIYVEFGEFTDTDR